MLVNILEKQIFNRSANLTLRWGTRGSFICVTVQMASVGRLVESHACSSQFLHQNVECTHSWVILGLLGIVEVVQLSHGSDVNIAAEVSKHSG